MFNLLLRPSLPALLSQPLTLASRRALLSGGSRNCLLRRPTPTPKAAKRGITKSNTLIGLSVACLVPTSVHLLTTSSNFLALTLQDQFLGLLGCWEKGWFWRNLIGRAACKSKGDGGDKGNQHLRRADSLDVATSEDDMDTKAIFDWSEFLLVIVPELGVLFASIISAFAVAILNVQIPLYLGEIVNIISKSPGDSESNYFKEMQLPTLHLLGVYAAQSVFTFVYITLLSSLGERVAARLRKQLFDTLIIQDIEFYDTHRTGELLNRLTTDIQDFKSAFKMCISQGLRSITQIIGSVGALFILSPTLTGVMMIAVPGMVGLGTLLGSSLRTLSKRAQAQSSKAIAVADEALTNIRTVKAFSMEEAESELFAKEIDESRKQYQELGLGIGIFQGLSNFALNGLILGVLFTGGVLMSREDLSAGSLMSFLVATQTIQRSLAQLSLLFGSAVKGFAAGGRVFEYLALEPKIAGGQGGIQDHRAGLNETSVRFNKVSFAYPARREKRVISELNLEVPRGKVVAICGKSGAGKSTIVALLERFYDPTSGSIHIAGRPITAYDVTWLRRRFLGLISQEPQLFHSSVRENIRYGRPEASDEEVERAATLANADAFIRDFPAGYDTLVGERGTAVSGGQKQRIAIARAILKDPALLVLDEATSALDAESERLVQDALDKVMKGACGTL